ncbi:MAG: alpha/beta fold hydrolase [bacterium]|nr:alpha/beta fold hydrolase [bacterium]
MRYFLPLLLSVMLTPLACTQFTIPTDGYVEVDGARLYYKAIGSGEPIVVLHGGPGFDHQTFLPDLELLAEHNRVIFYDQRGSGLSEGPVDSVSITIENFIADIEAIRKHFNIEKLNLLGHSWGGILAMHYAVEHPGNLNTLIVASAGASSDCFGAMGENISANRTPEDWEALGEIYESEEFKADDPAAIEAFWRIYFKVYFPDPSFADSMNLAMTERTIKNGNAVAGNILASVGDFDLCDALAAVTCPALVIHGEADPMPTTYAEQINECLPNSELVIVENAGHWLFVDGREPFCRSIAGFVKRFE